MVSGVGFEWTVRFGDVLTMLGAGVVAVGLVYNRGKGEAKMNSVMSMMKDDVTDMKDELKKLAQVITIQAVQDERIDNLNAHVVMLQRSLEDLRRGNGFIRGRAGVDGEYSG